MEIGSYAQLARIRVFKDLPGLHVECELCSYLFHAMSDPILCGDGVEETVRCFKADLSQAANNSRHRCQECSDVAGTGGDASYFPNTHLPHEPLVLSSLNAFVQQYLTLKELRHGGAITIQWTQISVCCCQHKFR